MTQRLEGSIAFVVPRYGPRVVGGAETLCRLLAENLTANGTPIDVLTTCAIDHFTWRDELPFGETLEGGVRVRRFPVGPRNPEAWAGRHAAIDLGHGLSYGEQVAWMADSVWSPGIMSAAEEYRWLVAMPYLFGTSFWATVADPERTVLIPCLHDEPHARQPAVLDMLCSARGLMLNAAGERTLVERLTQQHRGGTAHLRSTPWVVGGGFDEQPIPERTAVAAFCRANNTEAGYVLYAGRREEAKGVGAMYEHYRLYRETTANPRPLALMGSGETNPPDDLTPHVVDFGFVDLADRANAYAGASVLIQPSRLESFGMVLFEAWLAGTPALVNAGGDVLREHCANSGGGLWFSSGEEFAEALALMTSDERLNARLAAAGREYTLTDFRWSAVRERFHGALAEWA
jgi:glycosyltransferase involved in cell wall biosynthesis